MSNTPPDLTPAAVARLRDLTASGPLLTRPASAAADAELLAHRLAEPYDAESVDATVAGSDFVEALDNAALVEPACGGNPRCRTHRGGAYNMDAVGRRMECRTW